jgi:hypothetical protein
MIKKIFFIVICVILTISCTKQENKIIVSSDDTKPVKPVSDSVIDSLEKVSINNLDEFNKDSHFLLYSNDLDDFNFYITSFIEVYRKYSKSSDKKIMSKIKQLNNRLFIKCKIATSTEIEVLNELLAQNDDREILTYCLFITNASTGNIALAYNYGNIIESDFPNSNLKSDYFLQIFDKVSFALNELNELEHLSINNDETLFKKGEIYSRFCRRNNLFRTSISYDLKLAKNVFSSLIAKFPNSNYADNAEFFIINNSMVCEDGSYIPEMADKYSEFIKKYPNSDMIPTAFSLLCRLSFPYKHYEYKHKNSISVIENWRSNFTNFINTCPNDNHIQNIFELLDRINSKLGKKYSLTISSNQSAINLEDSLSLKVILTNEDDKEIKISKPDNYFSKFLISIVKYPSYKKYDSRTEQVNINLITNEDLKSTVITLEDNQQYIENIDLMGYVKTNLNNDFGHFELNSTGLYKIYCFGSLNGTLVDIVSNPIWLVIE